MPILQVSLVSLTWHLSSTSVSLSSMLDETHRFSHMLMETFSISQIHLVFNLKMGPLVRSLVFVIFHQKVIESFFTEFRSYFL